MPKPRKNQIIHCTFFTWKLYRRNGVWYADGRNQAQDLGRHTLDTCDQSEARQALSELDRRKAEDLGLAPRMTVKNAAVNPLSLNKGSRRRETSAG